MTGGVRAVVDFVVICNGSGFLQRTLLCVSGGVPATEPLRRGLRDLTEVSQHVLNTFQVSLFIHHQSITERNLPAVVGCTALLFFFVFHVL